MVKFSLEAYRAAVSELQRIKEGDQINLDLWYGEDTADTMLLLFRTRVSQLEGNLKNPGMKKLEARQRVQEQLGEAEQTLAEFFQWKKNADIVSENRMKQPRVDNSSTVELGGAIE